MWPTLLTLAMFPVLVVFYIRLARQEEHLVRQEFGNAYEEYANKVPAFLPGWHSGKTADKGGTT
jgi:protein-S-isoprenylcysteine O-methyltransferase Ste14